MKDQPWFYNQVAHYGIDAEIWAPEGFLSTLTAVEDQMYRERGVENGPRVIDLDMLLFSDLQQETGFLDLPHPRLKERAFMLVPLLELAPELVLPCGTSVKDALAAIDYRQEEFTIWQD